MQKDFSLWSHSAETVKQYRIQMAAFFHDCLRRAVATSIISALLCVDAPVDAFAHPCVRPEIVPLTFNLGTLAASPLSAISRSLRSGMTFFQLGPQEIVRMAPKAERGWMFTPEAWTTMLALGMPFGPMIQLPSPKWNVLLLCYFSYCLLSAIQPSRRSPTILIVQRQRSADGPFAGENEFKNELRSKVDAVFKSLPPALKVSLSVEDQATVSEMLFNHFFYSQRPQLSFLTKEARHLLAYSWHTYRRLLRQRLMQTTFFKEISVLLKEPDQAGENLAETMVGFLRPDDLSGDFVRLAPAVLILLKPLFLKKLSAVEFSKSTLSIAFAAHPNEYLRFARLTPSKRWSMVRVPQPLPVIFPPISAFFKDELKEFLKIAVSPGDYVVSADESSEQNFSGVENPMSPSRTHASRPSTYDRFLWPGLLLLLNPTSDWLSSSLFQDAGLDQVAQLWRSLDSWTSGAWGIGAIVVAGALASLRNRVRLEILRTFEKFDGTLIDRFLKVVHLHSYAIAAIAGLFAMVAMKKNDPVMFATSMILFATIGLHLVATARLAERSSQTARSKENVPHREESRSVGLFYVILGAGMFAKLLTEVHAFPMILSMLAIGVIPPLLLLALYYSLPQVDAYGVHRPRSKLHASLFFALAVFAWVESVWPLQWALPHFNMLHNTIAKVYHAGLLPIATALDEGLVACILAAVIYGIFATRGRAQKQAIEVIEEPSTLQTVRRIVAETKKDLSARDLLDVKPDDEKDVVMDIMRWIAYRPEEDDQIPENGVGELYARALRRYRSEHERRPGGDLSHLLMPLGLLLNIVEHPGRLQEPQTWIVQMVSSALLVFLMRWQSPRPRRAAVPPGPLLAAA